MTEETETPKPADVAGRLDGLVSHELSVLWQFYYCWTKAESTRGCYSCCEAHDCRCPKSRGIGDCTCWRDELTKLENELETLMANAALTGERPEER